MRKFITIGYGDQDGYDRTPKPGRDAAYARDAQLAQEGAIMGIAGRQVQIRNPESSGLQITEGPYLSSDLPVAGFAVIEAETLAAAIELVSNVPCAVAHGVVEIWPLDIPGQE